MCGRFVGFRNIEQLKTYFPIDRTEVQVTANYNIAPTQPVLAIVRHGSENVLEPLHWGLVPFWAKDTTLGTRLINARWETVAEKPSFREAFKKRRCLIPADGFYEWMKVKNKKQPVFITLPQKTPFAFAGLWEIWRHGPKGDSVYRSCTILTHPASPSMQAVHHRMPVILPTETYGDWLDTDNHHPQSLLGLMAERALTEMVFEPVSPRVNAVGHNDPSNIKPIQMDFDF